MKQAIYFMIFALWLVGCSNSMNTAPTAAGLSSTGTGSAVISVSNAYPNKDGQVSFATSVISSQYNWSVTGPNGENLFPKCNQMGPRINCNALGVAGAITVAVNGAAVVVKVLDAGVVNQPPLIDCKVTLLPSGQFLRRVTSISATNDYEGAAAAGQTVHFDCRATRDENISGVRFYLSINNQPFVEKSIQFDYSPATPGTQSLVLRAVDEQQVRTDQVFDFPVACAGAPSLDIDASKVKIALSETHNYFDFNATGAAMNSPGPFQYRWDFDADEIWDKYDVNNPQAWTSNPISLHVFTQFSGARSVRLGVRDVGCNWFAYKTVPLNFNIDRVPGPLAPTSGRDYILQADLSGLNGNTSAAANGEFTQWQTPPTDSNPIRLECNFNRDDSNNRSVIEIQSYNSYVANSSPDKHGFYFKIDNIVDNGGSAQQNRLSTDAIAPNISVAQYETADGGDQAPKLVYQKSASCPVNVHISRRTAVVPCSSGGTANEETITMSGEFSCNELSAVSDATSKKMQLQKGYFYCETRGPNQCPGGGGGGGGGIPPILR